MLKNNSENMERIQPFCTHKSGCFKKVKKTFDMKLFMPYNFLVCVAGVSRSFYGENRKRPELRTRI